MTCRYSDIEKLSDLPVSLQPVLEMRIAFAKGMLVIPIQLVSTTEFVGVSRPKVMKEFAP